MQKIRKFNEVSVGCDGEGFLLDSRGKPVPAVGLLGGEKGKPLACEGGGYLEDCVAWEINPDPVGVSEGKEKFIANVVACLDAVRRKATTLDLEVDISPSRLFKKQDLLTEQASVSGCSDSFDCWELRQLDKVDLSVTNHRFASGDIHVGFPWADESVYARINVARMLDILFGLTEVAVTPKSKRVEFYGKAGIHRPTEYGVESKTAGNFWMGSTEGIGWAFDTAVYATKYVETRKDSAKEKDVPMLNMFKGMAVAVRNNWDRKEARNILSNFSPPQFPG